MCSSFSRFAMRQEYSLNPAAPQAAGSTSFIILLRRAQDNVTKTTRFGSPMPAGTAACRPECQHGDGRVNRCRSDTISVHKPPTSLCRCGCGDGGGVNERSSRTIAVSPLVHRKARVRNIARGPGKSYT